MTSTIKNRILAGALMATLAIVPVANAQHTGHGTATTAPAGKASATDTQAALRDLWVDHIFWVRSVVVATLAGDQAARAAAEKSAVANAKALAGSIAPFYGQEASDKLFTLLGGHYGAVKQYLDAGTDQAKKDAAIKAINDNAGQIATFLSGANPNLPKEAVLALLAAHGGHHITQINQLRAKQYDQEAETWEAMKSHMYKISDTIAGAIAKQFPDKFAQASN